MTPIATLHPSVGRRKRLFFCAANLRRACWLIALLGAGGCGGSDSGKKIIRFWQFWDSAVVEPMAREYESRNPDVRVQIEQLTWQTGLVKIQAAVASGTQPDVCELGSTWVPRFSSENVLEDMTPVYQELADSFLMWDSARWRGRIYGLPWVQGSRVLFYNRRLFARAGLDPDKPPDTWSALLEAAKRIEELGGGIHGFGMNMGERYVLYKKFMALAWGNGGRIIDAGLEKAVFNSPPVLECMRFYIKLASYSLKEKQEVLDHYFKSGKLGMQISGAWNLKNYAVEAPELDYAVALVPKPDEGGYHSSFAGAEMLVVFKNSQLKPESVKFARFLQSYPQARKLSLNALSVFPAAKKAFRDTSFTGNERLRVFIMQALTSQSPPAHPHWVKMEDTINDAIESVLYNKSTPEEALKKADSEIQEIIDQFEAK